MYKGKNPSKNYRNTIDIPADISRDIAIAYMVSDWILKRRSWPSTREMMDKFGMSRSTAWRHLMAAKFARGAL